MILKIFIEYSNDKDNNYKNVKEYNPNKKREILIVFDDMIADMLSNKKLNPIVTESFIRGRILNNYLILLHNLIFLFPTHYFVMKIPNKRELSQIAFNHSSDISFQDFMNLFKSVLQNHTLSCY